MHLKRVLRQLIAERERLDRAIAALQSLEETTFWNRKARSANPRTHTQGRKRSSRLSGASQEPDMLNKVILFTRHEARERKLRESQAHGSR